jgi:hypothetical protein
MKIPLVMSWSGGKDSAMALKEPGAPSFPVLLHGKGGVLRPRFRLGFSIALFKFAIVYITK